MRKILIYFLVILFFTIFTFFSTYPLIIKMDTAVKNLGDPVLNVWILNWDIHKFLTGISNFFDANIFYPHRNTLAYSEHLIPQALLALPVYLITHQPIFIYNFLFILSFILSGLGMFFLAEHLTKNKFASLLAGFIFAFSPFRFGHLGHLQILSMQWIPFTFLFLHKFIEESKIKDLIFFLGFFILQALSCSYYAFFLTVAILIMFIFLLINRKLNTKKISALIFAGIFAGLILFPFFYPYYKFKKEMNFSRPASEVEYYSAQVQNYLALPSGNRLLGKLTKRFVGTEAQLFPGITVLVFAIVGMFKWPGKKGDPVRSPNQKRGIPPFRGKSGISSDGVNRILEVLMILNLLMIIFLQKYGGFDFNLAGCKISLHSLRNPLYLLFLLIIIRWLNSREKNKFLALDYRTNLYLILAISSFILSLGPSLIIWNSGKLINLPYLFLYNHIPGFQGLRVPARWGCFFIFSLSVLAGMGIKRAFNAFKKGKGILKWMVAVLVFSFLVSESIYIPIGYAELPKRDSSVYNWLAKQKDDFAIIELPMPIDGSRAHYEAEYMYRSIYHWKPLVNGYSGFFPPDYWPINRKMQRFPSFESVEILEQLGIKYVIVHFAMLDGERITRIKNQIPEFNQDLRIKKKFGEDYVIEIIPKNTAKTAR